MRNIISTEGNTANDDIKLVKVSAQTHARIFALAAKKRERTGDPCSAGTVITNAIDMYEKVEASR